MNVNVPSGAMCWGRESTFKHTRTPWPERERERTRDRRERGRDVRVTTWCWCDMVLCPQNPSHLCPSSGSEAALSFPVSGPPCIGSSLSLSLSLPPYLSALAALCPTPSLAFSLTFHAPSSTPPCSPPPCRLCTSAGSRRSCAKHARAPKCAKPSRMRGGREARPQQRQRNRRWCRHDDDDDVYRYYNC